MGTLLHRCVEVHKAIELSFGVVSGVGPGIHVLHGGPRASRGRSVSGMVFGRIRIFASMQSNGQQPMIDSCVKNRQYFHTHCIPLNSASNSLSYDIVRFKIKVGVDAKFM